MINALSVDYPIEDSCQSLGVSRSSYYQLAEAHSAASGELYLPSNLRARPAEEHLCPCSTAVGCLSPSSAIFTRPVARVWAYFLGDTNVRLALTAYAIALQWGCGLTSAETTFC
jgi:hypothetical protein